MEKTGKYKYLVCVTCPTFNQAEYIEKTMNGFCNQETKFPYICTIVDDCSTDGEQTIIEDYLTRYFEVEEIVKKYDTDNYLFVFSRHKTNQNCYFGCQDDFFQ